MPKVSVLVSIYNAEATISRCLDSLLGQTIQDIQIICIDDASTDSSLNILHQYQHQYSCIDVVSLPENHGQAYARNQGIPLIKAEYTAFLDSDDYMAPDAMEKALAVFVQHPETDCVLLDVRYRYPDGHEHGYRTPPFSVLSGYDAFVKSLKWDVHGWYVARTELYKQFPFDETCHSYSDDNVTMAHYLHSRNVRCSTGKYYFIQREDSCTHQATIRRFDWLIANESLHKKLIEWNIPHDVIDMYEEQRWYILIGCFWFYNINKKKFTKAQRAHALNLLRHAWENIDTATCLPFNIRYKFGYMPLRPFWLLFKWQEWLLYQLRKLKYEDYGKKKC